MRKGHNPMSAASADAMPAIVAAAIVHLPNLKGYHQHRLEVVQACLLSMRKNLPSAGSGNVAVMVWDNGSCAELRDWLHEEYKPDYLVQSPNVGKGSARASILRMFPETTTIALSDDDMLFYPGWLNAQKELLDRWPNVGAVSGWPVRTQLKSSISATVEWAKTNALIHRGHYIPEQELVDFAVSIGHESTRSFLEYINKEDDILIDYKGMKALANAQHCQFVCRAGVILPITTWERAAMANERPFDAAINSAGLLRLTTMKRYARHLGNVIDETTRKEIIEDQLI